MSETTSHDTVAADGPALRFERKIVLSIYMNPSVYYVGTDPAQPYPFLVLTRDAARAATLTLYRIMDTDKLETFALAYTPAADTPPMGAGSLITVYGNSGPVAMMPSMELRTLTRFTVRRNGDEFHFQHQDTGLFLSAEAITGTPTFFLAPDRDMFHGHAWKGRTVTEWDPLSMDGADLRYVAWLKYAAKPGLSFRNANLRHASFSRAALADSKFTGANCTNAHFIGADLTRCDFTGATVKGASFEGVTGSGMTAPKVDFADVAFNGSSGPAVFNGANFDGAKFDGRDLAGVSFSGASLKNARLDKCPLGPAQVSGGKIASANFTAATLTDAVLAEAIAPGAAFDGATLTGADLSKTQLRGASFKKATLTRAKFAGATVGAVAPGPKTDFTEAVLYNVDFTDCRLTDAVLATPAKFIERPETDPAKPHPLATLRGCTVPLAVLGTRDWRQLDLGGATIVGTLPDSLEGFLADYCVFPDNYDLKKRELRSARFRHARLVGANLTGATATNVQDREQAPDFAEADLTSATLFEATLPRAIFDGALLHGVKMSYATLTLASFAGARLDTVVVAGKQLRANLSYCGLRDANFENAFLGKGQSSVGANMSYVTFTGDKATITNATLDATDFSNAYLAGVDFTGNGDQSMVHVNFSGACLANCTFKKASLQSANLSGACLFGADFTDADLYGASLSGASVWFETVELDAKRPDGRQVKIECRPTVIAAKATNDGTTCPNGDTGPCSAEASWQRRDGKVTVWPIPSLTPPAAGSDETGP